MDSKRTRRTISAPLGDIALAAALILAIPAAASAAGPATAWTRQFGSSETDSGAAIATDEARNVYVAGCTSGTLPNGTSKGGTDAFLRMFRSDGRTLRTRQFGTSGTDIAHAVAIDSRDRILVAGWTDGAFLGQTNKGGNDAFVRAYRH